MEKTPYEKAVEEAERLTKIARDAFRVTGRYTLRIDQLIDEADKAWLIVDKMLGKVK